MEFLKGGYLLFSFFLLFSCLSVDDLVIDLLTDFGGEFLNRTLEDTLVNKAFPCAVNV